MSDPHAPIALDRVAIIGYGIPISIGGNPRLFRSAVGGIVFNLFRGRGAHFSPQKSPSPEIVSATIDFFLFLVPRILRKRSLRIPV